MTIRFEVPGHATPERKRQVRRGSWTRRVDTPDAAAQKAAIRLFAGEAMNGEPPLQGPVQATIRVYKPKPKSWPKRRWAWTTKPDCSNFAKLFEDACTGIVWQDDAQIVRLVVEKVFDARARVECEAEELEGAATGG